MKADEFESLIASLSYKPGTEFRLSLHLLGSSMGWLLDIVQFLPSARNGCPDMPIVKQVFFTKAEVEYIRDDLLLHKICEAIRNMELHEVDEWFKVRGELYRDPHPNTPKDTITMKKPKELIR